MTGAKAMAEREGKYLTFTLDKYGIGILKIKEIIGMMPFEYGIKFS